MNRREFMRRMFGVAVTIAVPDVRIFPKTALDKLNEFRPGLSPLYGLPYHMSDASMASWLGFERASLYGGAAGGGKSFYNKAMIDLINKIMQKSTVKLSEELDESIFKVGGQNE